MSQSSKGKSSKERVVAEEKADAAPEPLFEERAEEKAEEKAERTPVQPQYSKEGVLLNPSKCVTSAEGIITAKE